jgi:hypothetical protein
MDFKTACSLCHVRSAIYRTSSPTFKYWKNHFLSLASRVPLLDQQATDWEEFDPRDHEECPEFNEVPA